ncbi:hypothetical protein [Candidatus Sulfurimonas baltica]|uniref:Cytochrome c domain-containing protein n=1 Tax=Candidatus Sulfurimonas baltica TaxID=2740404 RepID=A0A7S7LTE3_9BACT|nr:hypothetical protein [Candidatus Sulfurimonas baltica]QOY51023.1 hypothetical protein HUE88_07680 [Candidatus Sulfurimonas baltica]
MKKQTYLQILFFITAMGIIFFYNSKYHITLNEDAFPITIEEHADKATVELIQIETEEVSVKAETDSNLSVVQDKNTTVVKKEIISSVKKIDKKIEKPILEHKPKLVNKNRKFIEVAKVEEIPLDIYNKYDAKTTKKQKIYKKEIIVLDNTNFDIVDSPIPDEILTNPRKSYKQKQYKDEKAPKKLEDIKRVAVLSDYKKIKVKKIDKPVENVRNIKRNVSVSLKPDGENIYSNRCRLCHGKSESLIEKYTAERWRELLANDGSSLNSVHEKTMVSKLTQSFYKSKNYSAQFASLKDFIISSLK